MSHYFLYILVFFVSGAGFLTQTLISGYWTSAFSDDVLNYSLHISIFFLSLGLGALIAEKIMAPSKRLLYGLWFSVALWMGLVIPFLKCCIVWLGGQLWIPLLLLGVQGSLVGSIVPLVLKYETKKQDLSLGKLFFIDYISALVVSVVFTFVLLIPLGFTYTAIVASSVSFSVLVVTWFVQERRIGKEIVVIPFFVLSLFFAVQRSQSLVSFRKENERSSKVVFSRQSHYQKIVLMEEISNEPSLQGQRQYVLYLDGFLQFASVDEQSYHACLANIPLMASFSKDGCQSMCSF